jgi:hypothetical protein
MSIRQRGSKVGDADGNERGLSGRCLEVLAIDPAHLGVSPRPRGGATGRGGAEVPEVQIVDAGTREVGGQGGLGKPRRRELATARTSTRTSMPASRRAWRRL